MHPPPPRPAMGRRIVRLESAPSTSDIAKNLVRAGEPHGTVVVAREQTRGRGQRGRRWASPRGGLWASLLARPAGLSVAQAGLLSIAAAVAAAEAASAVSGACVRLKWPNDLMVAGRKACLRHLKVGGVLVETAARGGEVEWAVIGVGINANTALDALPGSLRATAGSLRDAAGCDIPLDGLLREVCARVERLLAALEAGEHAQIVRRWRALDATPGRIVRRAHDQRWRGRAQGIDARGRLVIRTPQGRTCIATSQGLVIE